MKTPASLPIPRWRRALAHLLLGIGIPLTFCVFYLQLDFLCFQDQYKWTPLWEFRRNALPVMPWLLAGYGFFALRSMYRSLGEMPKAWRFFVHFCTLLIIAATMLMAFELSFVIFFVWPSHHG